MIPSTQNPVKNEADAPIETGSKEKFSFLTEMNRPIKLWVTIKISEWKENLSFVSQKWTFAHYINASDWSQQFVGVLHQINLKDDSMVNSELSIRARLQWTIVAKRELIFKKTADFCFLFLNQIAVWLIYSTFWSDYSLLK